MNNLSVYPTAQVQVRDVVCKIVAVDGANQDGIGYANDISYTMDVYSLDGIEPARPDIVPVGQRWPFPFKIRTPRIDTPEAWCKGIQYGPDLLVFVNEVPDWGPCNGEEPNDDPGGTPSPTPGLRPRPIGPDIPVFGRSDPLARLIANSSDHTLAMLGRAIRAAGGTV